MVKREQNIQNEHIRNADLSMTAKLKKGGTNEYFCLF